MIDIFNVCNLHLHLCKLTCVQCVVCVSACWRGHCDTYVLCQPVIRIRHTHKQHFNLIIIEIFQRRLMVTQSVKWVLLLSFLDHFYSHLFFSQHTHIVCQEATSALLEDEIQSGFINSCCYFDIRKGNYRFGFTLWKDAF